MRAAKPLTAPVPSDLDNLRTLIWVAVLLSKSRQPSPNHIELAIRKGLTGLSPESSGNLRAFAKRGGPPPYRKGKSPKLKGDIWPSRAERMWDGGTRAWLDTPFWYLMEHQPDLRGLLECIELLPAFLQEELVVPQASEGSQPELANVAKTTVLELSLTVSPMALGALACAMRRARINGDAYPERQCAVAMAWMLMTLHEQSAPRLLPLLEHLLHWFLLEAADYVYSPGLLMPLRGVDVEQFDEERQEHANWSVEGELARQRFAERI